MKPLYLRDRPGAFGARPLPTAIASRCGMHGSETPNPLINMKSRPSVCPYSISKRFRAVKDGAMTICGIEVPHPVMRRLHPPCSRRRQQCLRSARRSQAHLRVRQPHDLRCVAACRSPAPVSSTGLAATPGLWLPAELHARALRCPGLKSILHVELALIYRAKQQNHLQPAGEGGLTLLWEIARAVRPLNFASWDRLGEKSVAMQIPQGQSGPILER